MVIDVSVLRLNENVYGVCVLLSKILVIQSAYSCSHALNYAVLCFFSFFYTESTSLFIKIIVTLLVAWLVSRQLGHVRSIPYVHCLNHDSATTSIC